ncbi:MAG: hypothetical protein RLW62_19705, partial [Gammaproteobacteria bacterium]
TELDGVVAGIDDGLSALATETAGNRASSASVLAVDVTSRQRSTIRIQTQEGDLVMLDLRRRDTLSARSAAVSDGAGASASASATTLELSSRSKLRVSVEGHLNEAELGAIRDVLAQAEKVADGLFDAGSGAPTPLAIDTTQLAAVDLRIRARQTTSITLAEMRAAPAAASAPALPATATSPA